MDVLGIRTVNVRLHGAKLLYRRQSERARPPLSSYLIRNADRPSPQGDNTRGTVVGGRPTGYPRSCCECEASCYGQIRPDLNLAANWKRKIPQASPAPGMAAVRNNHVFVLMRHIDGIIRLVHDGNSGHRLTRDHVRSI
jgi:hypothetical protein